jgi:copper chaperone CopZ
MKQIINVEGMTCNGCVATVKKVIGELDHVQSVEVSLESKKVVIISNQQISADVLKKALPEKYTILNEPDESINKIESKLQENWLQTYKPLLLIFGYILFASIIIGYQSNGNKLMVGMNSFMAGFFLVFSFFKMLDLTGFATSYAMYDVIAKKWKVWGYIYPFIELGLGFSFVADCCPTITNWITLIVMTVSLIGVVHSIIDKRKIKCACLGTVFNLPMTTVTIVEDGLMILMSVIMLFLVR